MKLLYKLLSPVVISLGAEPLRLLPLRHLWKYHVLMPQTGSVVPDLGYPPGKFSLEQFEFASDQLVLVKIKVLCKQTVFLKIVVSSLLGD